MFKFSTKNKLKRLNSNALNNLIKKKEDELLDLQKQINDEELSFLNYKRDNLEKINQISLDLESKREETIKILDELNEAINELNISKAYIGSEDLHDAKELSDNLARKVNDDHDQKEKLLESHRNRLLNIIKEQKEAEFNLEKLYKKQLENKNDKLFNLKKEYNKNF